MTTRATAPPPLTDEQRRIADENRGIANWWAKKKYQKRARRARIEWAELLAACEAGVEDAARGFDPSRGIKFAAYARGFILGRISRLFRSHDCRGGQRRPRGRIAEVEAEGLLESLDEVLGSEIFGRAFADMVGTGEAGGWELEMLRRRIVGGQTQAAMAVETGYSVRTLRRLEREATEIYRRLFELVEANPRWYA